MSPTTAAFLLEKLTAFALVLASIEVLVLQTKTFYKTVWSLERISPWLELNVGKNKLLLEFVFSDKSFLIQQWLLLGVTLVALVADASLAHWGVALVLFLLQAIRFKGTFNGGSDMMLMVLITGNLLNKSGLGTLHVGLLYVGIHLLLSYMKAGFVKLKEPQWRQGQAIPFLINHYRSTNHSWSLFVSDLLARHRILSTVASWCIILFELGILLVLVYPSLTSWYFCLALFFHFINFIFFGLNRFFWAWLAAWPALLSLNYLT